MGRPVLPSQGQEVVEADGARLRPRVHAVHPRPHLQGKREGGVVQHLEHFVGVWVKTWTVFCKANLITETPHIFFWKSRKMRFTSL